MVVHTYVWMYVRMYVTPVRPSSSSLPRSADSLCRVTEPRHVPFLFAAGIGGTGSQQPQKSNHTK